MQLGAARDVSLRTVAFFVAFTVATGVAARMGNAEVGAHQIGFQIWILIALVLDATAIAAQALVGGLLGAGATSPPWSSLAGWWELARSSASVSC